MDAGVFLFSLLFQILQINPAFVFHGYITDIRWLRWTCSCTTLAGRWGVPEGAPTLQGLCQALRAVAVVTTSEQCAGMALLSALAILETQDFQLTSGRVNVNRQFVQMPCVLMSSFCTSYKHRPPHINSLESLVYSKRVYLQRAF